jgi:RND family efflux transporter MFP subunit
MSHFHQENEVLPASKTNFWKTFWIIFILFAVGGGLALYKGWYLIVIEKFFKTSLGVSLSPNHHLEETSLEKKEDPFERAAREKAIFVELKSVHQDNISKKIILPGKLICKNAVDIVPEADGIVEEIRVISGQMVQKGDVLFILNEDMAKAQLAAAQAELDKFALEYERSKKLLQEKALSPAKLQEAKANFERLKAQTQQQEILLKQRKIRAPFAGKIGNIHINLGQRIYPQRSEKTLFLSDEKFLIEFQVNSYQSGIVELNKEIFFNLRDVDGISKPFRAVINAIDNKIDRNQTLEVQAIVSEIKGKNNFFVPGRYVEITLRYKEIYGLFVPKEAVSVDNNSNCACYKIIERNGKSFAVMVGIEVGLETDKGYQVLNGLEEGDQVVVSGISRLPGICLITTDPQHFLSGTE